MPITANKKRVLEKCISLFNKLFNLLGVHLIPVREIEPIEIGDSYISPVLFNYVSKSQAVLLEVPMAKGRSLPVFSFGENGSHPYMVSVQKAISSKDPKGLIKKSLNDFFSAYQPESAASLLGLEENATLKAEPSWATVMPWNSESIDQWKSKVSYAVRHENKVNGGRFGIDEGWAWAGPVSNKKLDIETERLYKVWHSILQNGYKRHNGPSGDIVAYVLIDENGNWVWQAQTGQHRAAVIAGLGYEKIHIRVTKVIYRSEVSHWPNVTNGLFSINEALYVFDRVFLGDVFSKPYLDKAQRTLSV